MRDKCEKFQKCIKLLVSFGIELQNMTKLKRELVCGCCYVRILCAVHVQMMCDCIQAVF